MFKENFLEKIESPFKTKRQKESIKENAKKYLQIRMGMVFHYIPFLLMQDGHATHVSNSCTIALDTGPIKRYNILVQ